jgi:MYXO-CTERM domain-containing protein
MLPTEPAAKLSAGDFKNIINMQIRAGALPAPDESSVFMIFLPPGVALNDGYGHNSCTDFCGYHYSMWADAGQARYIALPHPDCWNCRFTWLHDGLDMDDLNRDSTTLVMSHEMIETITDPDVGTGTLGWYDNANGEIADICGGSKGWFENGTLDGFRIQKEWSNADNSCVIERPVAPLPSGGCPGGMHLSGGVCLPDNPAGCSTAGQPALLALAAVALFALRGLRRRRRIA